MLAVGGNSLIADPKHTDVKAQYASCLKACGHIARLIEQGYRLVISHGNGPQVGFMLRRSELASKELHPVPLDVCVADTQGAIGYMFQRALQAHTHTWPTPPRVVTLVTQVEVDSLDPAFDNPTKPIGSFMDEETAKLRRAIDGWRLIEDAGRGFRRVVASPEPLAIVELEAIRQLATDGYTVISVGGGGIPVVRTPKGTFRGVSAVIDKDLASSLLALELKADRLLISTAVPHVSLRFGKPDEEALKVVSVDDAKRYIEEGHFGVGSMLPKIQAAVRFVEGGGKEAIITSSTLLQQALEGNAGTRIIPA